MDFASAFRAFLILCRVKSSEVTATRKAARRYKPLACCHTVLEAIDETYLSTQPTQAQEQARLPLAHEFEERA